jgi:hypothetical protein
MNPASAKTSLNQVPSLHKLIAKIHPFRKPCIFDFGAGKKGKVDAFMSENGFPYLPYDPFNRDGVSNKSSLDSIQDCDFVLCANVLNVLEDHVIDNVIKILADLTKKTKNKEVYLTVYHNPSLPKNRQVKNYFQRNEPADWYVACLEKHFKEVYLRGKILVCFA